MFKEGLKRALREAYKVVVFPLPVGPTTNNIPCGLLINPFHFLKVSPSIPNWLNSLIGASLGKSLKTTFSPKGVGKVETRKSKGTPSKVPENRPSCGNRLSAKSISAIALMAATNRLPNSKGKESPINLKRPSMR